MTSVQVPAAAAKTQIEAMYPVAGIQRGMIFHSLLAPRSGVYVLQDALRLPATLDREAFWDAWACVIRRHAVFRTLFVRLETDKPVQVVLRDVVLPRVELDWSGLDDSSAEQALVKLLREEQQAGFEFGRAPLMRLHLILRPNGWYFVWTRHHVLIDGWSGPLVMRDLMQAYTARIDGHSAELPPALSFQNYVRWLAAQDHDAARAFWRQRLQSIGERTTVPLLRAATVAERRVDDLRAHAVLAPDALRVAIERAARHWKVTQSVVMQAAWALLLARHGDHTDVLYGVTVSGRPAALEGVEQIVGPFINSVPARIVIEECSTLGDWMRTIQADNLARAEHEYLPLAEIQALAPDTSQGGLFDTLLVFDNYPLSARGGTGTLDVEPLSSFSYNNYPLTLMVMPGESLLLQFKYDGARFDVVDVERLMDRLQALLARMANAPDARVGSVQLLDAVEISAAAAEARGEAVPRDAESIVAAFAGTVAADPSRTALVFGDQTLTVDELDRESNRLAHSLLAYGVRAGDHVALCTRRNPHFVVGLLAILKSGAAYVPVDAEWPAARIQQVLAAAGVRVAVTEQACLEAVAGDGEHDLLSLDRDVDEIASFSDAALPPVGSQLTAYVIFTSGSSGEPKGVAVSHAALCEYVRGVLPLLALDGIFDVAALSTPAADLGHTALFAALCGGHTLRLLPESLSLDAIALAAELARRPVDMLKIVPSHLEALLTSLPTAALLPRRVLVLGGESASPALLNRVRTLSNCTIVNHYGPTEATVGAIGIAIEPDAPLRLGRPMANRSAHALDAGGRRIASGAVGELFIGGAALADGYAGDSRRTAERFVPDPFSDVPGARLYRTGDRVLRHADGMLGYVGRVDQQVKLRGYRIEPGEIEAVLRTLAGVLAAAVDLQRLDSGAPQWVAYIVANDTFDEARAQYECEGRLPEVMRPNRFVQLSALPLTANGKLDRRALPAADSASPVSRDAEPRTDVERTLVTVWGELLGRPIGVDINFFAAGGNSLLIIQAHGRIRKLFNNVELSVLDLFRYPTVARLADCIAALKSADAGRGPAAAAVSREFADA